MFNAFGFGTTQLWFRGEFPKPDHISTWRSRGMLSNPLLTKAITANILAIVSTVGMVAAMLFSLLANPPHPVVLVVLIITFLSSWTLGNDSEAFCSLIREGSAMLNLSLKEFVESDWEKLWNLPKPQMEKLAREQARKERVYPPFHPEREAAKRAFERAHGIFRDIGLIEYMGCDRYLKYLLNDHAKQ